MPSTPAVLLDRVRIVLVEPMGAANVGSVARAMANMGLGRLVLVSPKCDWLDDSARTYAVHARDILESAQVVTDIPRALDGCVGTFATTAKQGLYRMQVALAPRAAAPLALQAAEGGAVAVAFGPEDRGLLTRELLHFDRIVTIPSHSDYPVLNLAAAVMVVSYELFLAASGGAQRGEVAWPDTASARDIARGAAPAVDEQKRIMFERLFDSLDRVGFFFGQNPDHLRYALRHLLGRLDLSVNEADILIGMARQIRWYVDHHPTRVNPTSDRPPET